MDWILFAEDLKSSYLADNSLKYNKLQKHIPFHSVLLHKHPIMKKEITRLICAAICCTPIIGFAQTSDKFTSTDNLYKEGKELFQEKNYAAALPALKAFVKQKPATSLLQDAEYMLASSAYELKSCASISTAIRTLLTPTVFMHY